MPTLAWVLAAGVAMSLLALTGSLTLLLPDRAFKQLVLPLVALAAGSLVGGALCSTCSPRPSPPLGNRLIVYGWLAAGLFGFFLLEQYLHWHHCHRPLGAHRPLGYSDARGARQGGQATDLPSEKLGQLNNLRGREIHFNALEGAAGPPMKQVRHVGPGGSERSGGLPAGCSQRNT